jgi:CHAT domain-containing protein
MGKLIRVGEHREGMLRRSDPIRSKTPRGPDAHWTLQGMSGQDITIWAESYEFDVYLLLLDPLGRTLAWNDNTGGFFGARVETTLHSTGLYSIVVCGANADQYGTYWLSAETDGPKPDWSPATLEDYHGHGLEWSERNAKSRAASRLALELGRYHASKRDWDRASRYYAQSLARAEEDDYIYGQWAARVEKGRLLARRTRYDQAIDEFESALELKGDLRASADAKALVLVELGNLYYSMNSPEIAKIYFRTASQLAEQSALPSTLVIVYSSLNQVFGFEDREQAIGHAEMCYRLSEGLTPALKLKAAYTLAAAYLSLDSSRSEEGLELAADALRTARQFGGPDDQVSVITLISMGYYKLNRPDDMIRSAREALDLTSPDDEDPGPRRVGLQLIADGETLKGNYQAALQVCLQALEILERDWTQQSIEELRTSLLSQSKAICTQIIRNLYLLNSSHPDRGYVRNAFDFAERSRCRSLLEQLATEQERVSLDADPQMRDRRRRLDERISALGSELSSLRTEGPAAGDVFFRLQEDRAKVLAERMRLESEVHIRSISEVRKDVLTPITARQAQTGFLAIHRNTVILNYQLGVQESFVVVLGPTEARLFSLPNWSTISKAVQEWRAQVNNQLRTDAPSDPDLLSGYVQTASRLYDMLIKPAARFLRGRDLVVVPSDALYGVAFEGLVISSSAERSLLRRPRYLVEDHAITYAPSVSTLEAIEAKRLRSGPGANMLLLGDALPGRDNNNTGDRARKPETTSEPPSLASAQSLRERADWLPAAHREIFEVADLARRHRMNPTIWIGPKASKQEFVSANLSGYRFIHLATHGVADYLDGYFSSLTLSSDDKRSANDALTSREIANLKLGAELVVLSACETGVGQRVGAEGVIGLTRAFLVAGARRVCGSLWAVQDQPTEGLMKVFYDRLLAKGLRTSEALRQAKVALIRSKALPSQWAAFVLVGLPD